LNPENTIHNIAASSNTGPSPARHSKQTKHGAQQAQPAHQVQQCSKHLSTKSSVEAEEQNIRN